MNNKFEVYFKEKTDEMLNRIFKYEQTIIKDREKLEEYRDLILQHKGSNPDGTYKDVESEIKGFLKIHYYSFLLERALVNELERTAELVTAAEVLGVDLELKGENEKAVVNIKSNHVRSFEVNKDGSVGLLDSPLKPQIEYGVNQQLNDVEKLKDVYKNIIPLKKD